LATALPVAAIVVGRAPGATGGAQIGQLRRVIRRCDRNEENLCLAEI